MQIQITQSASIPPGKVSAKFSPNLKLVEKRQDCQDKQRGFGCSSAGAKLGAIVVLAYSRINAAVLLQQGGNGVDSSTASIERGTCEAPITSGVNQELPTQKREWVQLAIALPHGAELKPGSRAAHVTGRSFFASLAPRGLSESQLLISLCLRPVRGWSPAGRWLLAAFPCKLFLGLARRLSRPPLSLFSLGSDVLERMSECPSQGASRSPKLGTLRRAWSEISSLGRKSFFFLLVYFQALAGPLCFSFLEKMIVSRSLLFCSLSSVSERAGQQEQPES
ncbi:unnamed protein product [Diplocarpon coronariae]